MNDDMSAHHIEILADKLGAYLRDEGGMKWATLEELTELAQAHGFDSFDCLLDKVGVPFSGTLKGRGKRFKATPSAEALDCLQAIQFVKELSKILGRDQNTISAWEITCSENYDKVCHAIFQFVHATASQRAEALSRTIK